MPTYTAKLTGGTLRGSNSSDTIIGGGANDILWGLGGNDVITGGDGNDTIEGDGSYTVADAVRETGTAIISNASITTVSTAPALTSMGLLDSGLSVWRIRNTSNSAMTVVFQSATNGPAAYGPITVVVPAHSDDFITSPNTSTHKLFFNGSLVDTKAAGNQLFSYSDSYGVSVDGDDTLSGGNGNDIIRGGGGNDTLDGGNGDDSLDGGSGNDVIVGGAGADVLVGGDGIDTVSYQSSTAGVTALFSNTDGNGIGQSYKNLPAGGYAGDANGDTYSGFENFVGTAFRDFVGGASTAMTFNLGAGDDMFDTNVAYTAVDTVYGEAGNDVVWGGGGNDLLFGGAGSDTLYGEGDNDMLTGDEGDDTLDGGAGNDVLIGGAGADKLYGSDGVDTADYSSSTAGVNVNLTTGVGTGGDAQGDTLSGIENLIGSKFDDVLTGDTNSNTLDGGAGNDTLAGGAAADKLIGGSGVDRADYSASNAGVTVNLATGTGTGGTADGDTLSSIENVTGSSFGDTITGDNNANTVNAGAGNDYVDGGIGNDVIYGGDGDDTLTGNYGTDKMYGEGGNDIFLAEWDEGNGDYYNGGDGVDTYKIDGTVVQNYALQIDLATGTSQYHDTFISVENLIGGTNNDEFRGDAGVNQFWGRNGNDFLDGRGGNDALYGDAGDDVLIGGEGADTLVGGDGVDRVDYAYSAIGVTVNLATGVASDGDTLSTIENLTGSKFNDVLTGDAGVNVLDGGAGDDVLAGGAGADKLVGGDGIDTADYSSFAVSVTVNLATGANSDGDTLSSIENLTGSKLDDLLTGDAGANVLDGGAGNDVLIGGAGADVLTGGDGVDLADYSGSGAGVTVDLAAGTGLGGDAQGDTLSGVENILGSKFDDVIIGDGSANTVKAGSGNDYVDGGAGNDVIYGGDGDDTLTGNYGTDKMYGEGGNDTFLAEWDEGQGDYYNGGDGVDTYKIDGTIFQNYSLQIDLATGTDQYHDTFISVENLIGASAGDAFYGDAGVNQFWGRDGNDVLDGRGGNDNLFGENGDDTLAGGDGNDVLDGGAGNDTLAGGASGDKLIGGDGVDTLDYSASNAAVAINLTNGTATGGDAEGDVFDSVENVTGSKFDDVLNGNEGSNVLDGGEGNDVLSGGAGADKLVGGNGVDTADYSSSAVGVTVNLTTGANSDGDTLVGIENVTGTVFDDVLSGDAGANTLIGGDGNDILLGDAGADLLIGGDGIDVADYSTSAVGVYINLATGVNHGGDAEGDVLVGIENLKGSAFDDVLIGSAETTNLDGGGGNDILDYSLSLGGVTVNIATNFAFGGFATGDVISNFENLRGSASADDLSGNNGANQIFGGAGNDTISGGAGADVIDGGEGSDTVDYSSAVAGVTVNLATGANSDGDTLVSIENVKGSKFNDVISGDVQANVLDGGDGFDTLDYSASSAAIIVNLANNTVTSNLAAGDTVFNFEAINGSGFADTMTGDATANFLYGLAGNDTLYGGLGNDTLGGGDGNDRIYGGDGSDIVDGGLGTDTADYRYSAAAITVSLLTNTGLGGEAAGDQLISIENLSGSNFDDVLTGDAGVNRLVGRLGNDVLNGGAGNDYLDGGSGIDVLNGGDGIDTAEYTDSWAGVTVNLLANTGVGGEAKGDTFISIENVLGSQFDDIITGNAVNNRLNGDAGNDTLNGGDGNDMLVGGTGVDTLIGGAGDQDAAVYDTAASAVIVNLATGGTGGEAAGDTYNGVEYVIGSTFGDTITGDVAINRLMGGAGNDRIDGAAGNDYLLGEAGNDMLIGGAGADVFVFDKSFGKDTISDFWAGVGRTDRVWITNTDIHSFADVLSHSVDSAAGVVFTISTQDSITFTGLTVAQLHADDFIFV